MHIEHPYQNLHGGSWIKGNLHTHTTASDGERDHQDVIDDYAARGYDFLMISDHDVFTSESDYKAFDSRGMLLVPGNEVTAAGPHMLQIGGSGRVEPDADRQTVIDSVRSNGGLAVFNHPNWQKAFAHCPQEVLESSNEYVGIEIYNGVISRLEGSPYATNRWDILLGAGRRFWGYANDDSHRATGDVGLGWNVAYVDERTIGSLIESLASGRFYASTGVTLRNIVVDGPDITIETENAERIVALTDFGKRLATVDDQSIQVTAPENVKYVRFECWGSGERFAWTQPFFVS